jgi:hypothetical protein
MTRTEASMSATAPDMHRLLDSELSRRSRFGYVALLLASSAMTVVVTALWLTEPALPLRTQIALLVMSVIGLSWLSLSVWALTTRRVLLGRDGVVAGWMAVTFTAIFVVGAVLVGLSTELRGAYAAALLGVGLLAVAVIVLMRARRQMASLINRRDALERELGRKGR